MILGGRADPSDTAFHTSAIPVVLADGAAGGIRCCLEAEAGLQVLLELSDPDGRLQLQRIRYQAGRTRDAMLPFLPGTWTCRVAVRNVTSLMTSGPNPAAWRVHILPADRAPEPLASGPTATSGETARDEHAADESNKAPWTVPWGPGRWWVAGDLHQHSTESDGALDPGDLFLANRRRRLAFMALTDHQVLRPPANVPGLAVFGGTEITTPVGHVVALDAPTDRGLLELAPDAGPFGGCDWLKAACRTLRAAGAFLSACHPAFPPWDFRCGSLGDMPLDAVEILCDPAHPRAAEAADAALALWTGLLEDGSTLVGIGGSDFHAFSSTEAGFPEAGAAPGLPMTFAGCPAGTRDPESVRSALRAGRVAVGCGLFPGFALLAGDRLATAGDTIFLPSDRQGRQSLGLGWRVRLAPFPGTPPGEPLHCALVGSGGRHDTVSLRLGETAEKAWQPPDRPEGWIRMEVRNRDGQLLGFTNPVRWQRDRR